MTCILQATHDHMKHERRFTDQTIVLNLLEI